MGRGEHLGDLEALVLAAVVRVGHQASGTEVFREIESRSGREASLPSIHVTLRRLEDKGLVASDVGDPSPRGGRPRRYYRAAPAGIEALQGFRAMWTRVWSGLEIPDPETPT